MSADPAGAWPARAASLTARAAGVAVLLERWVGRNGWQRDIGLAELPRVAFRETIDHEQGLPAGRRQERTCFALAPDRC